MSISNSTASVSPTRTVSVADKNWDLGFPQHRVQSATGEYLTEHRNTIPAHQEQVNVLLLNSLFQVIHRAAFAEHIFCFHFVNLEVAAHIILDVCLNSCTIKGCEYDQFCFPDLSKIRCNEQCFLGMWAAVIRQHRAPKLPGLFRNAQHGYRGIDQNRAKR